MSANSHASKVKFVGFLKGLFRNVDKKDSAVPEPESNPRASAAKVSAPVKPAQSTALASTPAPAGQKGNGNCIHIPLSAILAGLPLELRARVLQRAQVDGLTIPVATDKILAQLATGVVKATFGEIRQAAPQVFSQSTSCDHVEVVLPLAEILARLNHVLLVRRPGQKQVIVPAEITSPFGAQGQGLVFSAEKTKAGAPAMNKVSPPSAPAVPAVPIARAATAVPPGTSATPATQGNKPRNPFVPPPDAVPGQVFKRAPVSPTSPRPPITPISPAAPDKPALPITPAPTQRKDPLTAVPVPRSIRPASPTTPTLPGATSPSMAEAPTISVSLSGLAQSWPEALRQEIVQLNLIDARLALPVGLVETALKRGRVAFPWKQLRSWVRPLQPQNVSVHDGVELELPLSVIAPLFVARQKAAGKAQQRVAIDETIPNLFFGLPTPEAVSMPAPAKPPVNKVVDTNYYIWDDVHDTARVDETEVKHRQRTGTDFVVKYATPNEIVSRAAALDGVAGALIALPDGLMVASRIPAEFNGDTLAAFLPQIFAKVSQTTRELRMGEVNNLNFTVGNVPWKIFRVNAIFFAAFGRVGEAMPTAPLAALAAELDRKNK